MQSSPGVTPSEDRIWWPYGSLEWEPREGSTALITWSLAESFVGTGRSTGHGGCELGLSQAACGMSIVYPALSQDRCVSSFFPMHVLAITTTELILL